jgi:hypothetical protein
MVNTALLVVVSIRDAAGRKHPPGIDSDEAELRYDCLNNLWICEQ